MSREILQRYGERVGFGEADLAAIPPGDPRERHINRLYEATAKWSIVARVIEAEHCNSGYRPGDRFVLDADGNFLAKLCPKRLCVYLAGQLAIPTALINERLSEGLDPNAFHFMHRVRCLDSGVGCQGYGRVLMEVAAEPREKS